MRKLLTTAVLVFCASFLFQGNAHAQQVDVAFGVDTLTAPSANSASGNHFPQSLTGGFYPTISGDVLFWHHLGAGAEVSWRGSRSYFAGDASQPFRPLFFDFNAVYAPPITHKIQAQLQAGMGAEDIRFYQNTYFYNPYTGSYTNYISSKHFMGDFGAGIKFYVWGHVFVRPEFTLFLVHDNYEFSSNHATRFGISIGYTLGHI